MATKKTPLTEDTLIAMYMDYTLAHHEKPKSVYQFSQINVFSESAFYTFFGAL
jgi:hypothetical protein